MWLISNIESHQTFYPLLPSQAHWPNSFHSALFRTRTGLQENLIRTSEYFLTSKSISIILRMYSLQNARRVKCPMQAKNSCSYSHLHEYGYNYKHFPSDCLCVFVLCSQDARTNTITFVYVWNIFKVSIECVRIVYSYEEHNQSWIIHPNFSSLFLPLWHCYYNWYSTFSSKSQSYRQFNRKH